MSKFCTKCGAPLGKEVKFCTGCGSTVLPAPSDTNTERDHVLFKKDHVASLLTEKIETKVKSKAKAYTVKGFSNTASDYVTAGEVALPLEFSSVMVDANGEGLISILKSGFRGLVGGFKRTLGDKKRLTLVIVLSVIWLVVNILAVLEIFPLPIKLLSWLTAAQGSILGGAIGKGLVAALLAQLISNKGMFKTFKNGLGQLKGMLKGGKETIAPLLFGGGIALVACNVMISSNMQNSMVCIAAFLLSIKAQTQNGFVRRLAAALLPKATSTTITKLMGGWTIGFALFAVISILPGGRNGYLLGILMLIVCGIMTIVGKNKKEVTAK